MSCSWLYLASLTTPERFCGKPGHPYCPEHQREMDAKQLLERLKELLVLDWRKRQAARVEDAIKDLLDTGLPRAYSTDLYKQKCSAVFEHFYESYPESDAGVYTGAD